MSNKYFPFKREFPSFYRLKVKYKIINIQIFILDPDPYFCNLKRHQRKVVHPTSCTCTAIYNQIDNGLLYLCFVPVKQEID